MKFLSVSFFILLSFAAMSQSYNTRNASSGVAMGLSGGYSTKQSVIGTLSIGAILKTNNHLSLNIILLGNTKNLETPSIAEARVGHFFSTWQVYGGAGYHIAGSDNKIASHPNTGIRPALGVIKHFRSSPWTISAAASGKIVSLQIGLFGVK
ncbi:hypothetical protein [Segetibacter sp.]|jgi:hypothetical protein|uniref:hypothetical protein n=1 Tax=Segetibacter sp. TaxID=2231182 RepID=UPI00263A20DD|nr:hypothetical protein [Segetibacter sp.]